MQTTQISWKGLLYARPFGVSTQHSLADITPISSLQVTVELQITVTSLSGGSTMSGGVISVGVQLVGVTSEIQGGHQFKSRYSIEYAPYTFTQLATYLERVSPHSRLVQMVLDLRDSDFLHQQSKLS